MMVRMQITLAEEDHRRVKARAAEHGISVAEYVRKLLAADAKPARPRGRIEEIFGLGDSGGSDIARFKDEYIGEAVEADWKRSTGRD